MTELLTVSARFQGPFTPDGVKARVRDACLKLDFLPPDVAKWWEVAMSAERLDPAADVGLSPSLFARILQEAGIAGELPAAQLESKDAHTYQLQHFCEAGQWSTATRFDTVFYVDARFLPGSVSGFTVSSSAYGDGRKSNSYLFAPTGPAKTGPVFPVLSPAAIASHAGKIYVGGKEGLFRLGEGQLTLVSLAKKQPQVTALCSDGAALYVGGEKALYKVVDDEVRETWTSKSGLPGSAALTLTPFKDAIFVGCSGGTAWIRGGMLEDARKEGPLKNLRHSCVDLAGNLWAGGENALFFAAPGQGLSRISGYRAVSCLTPFRGGVYAELFQGSTSDIKARLSDGVIDLLDLGPQYLPAVGNWEGDLLFENAGLVRTMKEGAKRLTFTDFAVRSATSLDGRSWLLGVQNGVCELLPESWSAAATLAPPLPNSRLPDALTTP